MKLKVAIDGETKEVELKDIDQEVLVTVDGVAKNYSVSEPEPDVFLLKNDGNIYEATVSESGDELSVSLRDLEVTLSVFDPKSLHGSGADSGSAAGTTEIVSAMPGKVVDVLVEEGVEVSKGDGILIVEAMKMQNELKSNKDGVVSRINVKPDEHVQAGDVLAVVE